MACKFWTAYDKLTRTLVGLDPSIGPKHQSLFASSRFHSKVLTKVSTVSAQSGLLMSKS